MMRGNRARLGLFCLCTWSAVFALQSAFPRVSSAFIPGLLIIIHAIGLDVTRRRRGPLPPPPATPAGPPPSVSVLIPAHNETAVIAGTVTNMLSLVYPDLEVLVVDDRSTDGTGRAVEGLAQADPRLRTLTRPPDAFPGKSAVLNDGLARCRGDIVCVFDAEARVAPDFLARVIPLFADPGLGAVQARKVYRNSSANTLTVLLSHEYLVDAHFQRKRNELRRGVEMRGNGEVIRRRALLAVGGWNNEALTDDFDLSTRLHLAGWDIAFADDVIVEEEAVVAFRPLLRQRRRWVEGAVRTYLDYLPGVFTRRLPPGKKLDILLFSTDLILPFWVVSDLFLHGIRALAGLPAFPAAPLAVFPLPIFFLALAAFPEIREYCGSSRPRAAAWALACGTMMTFLWTAMVAYVLGRIFFLKRRMAWGKTAHGAGNANS